MKIKLTQKEKLENNIKMLLFDRKKYRPGTLMYRRRTNSLAYYQGLLNKL